MKLGEANEESFRVPGIYTALKPFMTDAPCNNCFRVPGIYTALKLIDRPSAG